MLPFRQLPPLAASPQDFAGSVGVRGSNPLGSIPSISRESSNNQSGRYEPRPVSVRFESRVARECSMLGQLGTNTWRRPKRHLYHYVEPIRLG